MKKGSSQAQVLIIIAVFIFSRIIAAAAGLHFNIRALSAYWQYLDIETLKNNLLNGLWYDHAQPPLFNLFLGLILKISGNYSGLLFALILKLISISNALILFSITRRLCGINFLPLLVSVAYVLSPAVIVFESELFYTTFISFLLLVSVYFIVRFTESRNGWHACAIISPLVLICLTHSIYHYIWLAVAVATLLFSFSKKQGLKNLLAASLAGLVLVGSWYLKNKVIFGRFTPSTWMGMNLARNVFHDNAVYDSGRIEAYTPFSKISVYRPFLDPRFENKYKGLNDRDLLGEMKNDSFINETEVSYIPVSDLYLKASLNSIRSKPGSYMKNVIQSSVIYFTPATVYSLTLEQTAHIKNYDLLYSFNLTHFARDKQQRRILLSISAIPKILLYCLVFFILIRHSKQSGNMTPWNLFMIVTIGYVFIISSAFEHYENMRFRFEAEPLFMILAAQVFSTLRSRFRKPGLTPGA